jgi:RNA polymerase sigma factor for flagellar operon FliA
MSAEFVGAPDLDRDKLILDHVPLLQHIVGRMSYDIPGRVQRDDLFGWGMRGLIEAADGFEPGRGLGAPPSPEEIAQRMGVGIDEVDEVLHSARVACWASLEGGPSEELGALLADPRSEDPVGSAEWKEMKQMLVECITALPEPEKTVITLYYGEELLLKEIGEILGVTESRVSQVHSRALYRLNRELRRAFPTV